MNDRVLDKYLNQKSDKNKEVESADETDSTDDFVAFGWLRGIRDRATMLELRRKNGNIDSLSYGLLGKAQFDPSDGITLHFVDEKIRIQGRNLNKEIRPSIRLFEGITRHRVPWLQEACETTAMEADADQTIIESIS